MVVFAPAMMSLPIKTLDMLEGATRLAASQSIWDIRALFDQMFRNAFGLSHKDDLRNRSHLSVCIGL